MFCAELSCLLISPFMFGIGNPGKLLSLRPCLYNPQTGDGFRILHSMEPIWRPFQSRFFRWRERLALHPEATRARNPLPGNRFTV